jgi:hypothetical protein
MSGKLPTTAHDNYIIASFPQSAETKRLLLSETPPGAKVYVQSITGRLWYEVREKVQDSDTLVLNKRGKVIFMKGKPGRPLPVPPAPPVKSAPVKSAPVKTAPSVSDVDKFVQLDPLVRAARTNSDSPQVLSETIIRLTEIASMLAKERSESIRNGESISATARREVSTLIAVRDASLRRVDQRLRKQEIDLDGVPFKNLYVFIIRTFANAMDAVGMPSTEIDNVLSQVGKEVDTPEWKQRALKELQGGFR